jgi:5-methylcytosine-specific restriction enzyme A
MKISNEATMAAYEVAKRVREGTLNRAAGIEELHKRFSLNRGSAGDAITNIGYMLEGECYERTNNAFATEHFLEMIHHDYGVGRLTKALSAVEKHLEYYEGLPRGSRLLKIRKIVHKYRKIAEESQQAVRLAEEVQEASAYREGSVQRILVNRYERDPQARADCIKHYGPTCVVCGFKFVAVYGSVAEGYIHVHHLTPLAEIGEQYEVDPIADLRPVCANCHAVIHLGGGCRSLEEVRSVVDPRVLASWASLDRR